MTYISPRAELAGGIVIGRNVTILGPCRIGPGVVIEANCIVGKPSATELRAALARNPGAADITDGAEDIEDAAAQAPTVVGAGSVLMAGTHVYAGVTLAEGVRCEDRTVIRGDTHIGRETELKYGCWISSHVRIGHSCRIAGFVANDCRIGDRTSSFGQLIHAYTRSGGGRRDPAPELGDRVTVGFGALVIGGVTVGDDSYVAAGAIVTKPVPPGTVVTGVNVQTALDGWPGPLREEYPRSF